MNDDPNKYSNIANWEIAVYALYLKDGASTRIHTEDVALKCFELAPDSFSWIKYPTYPDKEVARSSLVDARKDKNGILVSGRSGSHSGHWRVKKTTPTVDGWQLTEAGVAWILENEKRLNEIFKSRETKSHRQKLLKRLNRVRNHSLFVDFKDQPEGFVVSIGSIAEILRCRVDAEKAIWDKRFNTLRNQAKLADQKDVLIFLERCQTFVNSKYTPTNK